MTSRDDGGIWRLNWERTPAGYRGWVALHPKLCVTADTFEELDKRLVNLVVEKLQSGEWTADWLPPKPAESLPAGARVLDSHVALSWQGRFVCLQDPDELFESYCLSCGTATGPRRDNPIRMFIELEGNLAADFDSAPGLLLIVQEQLAAALSKLASDKIAFTPVVRLGRARTSYLEPSAPSGVPICRPVALRDPMFSGTCCPTCGFEFLYHHDRNYAFRRVYRQRDIDTRSDVILLGDLGEGLDIGVRADWWKSVRGKRLTMGVVARAIVVAEDSVIDPTPSFTMREVSTSPYAQTRRQRWHWLQNSIPKPSGVRWTPWKV